jgi:hypothetical protein
MTEPLNDPRLSEPITGRSDSGSGMWGWIAGAGIVVLIAIVLIAGWSSNDKTESVATVPPAATTGSAPALSHATPPSTTGAGSTAHPTAPVKPAMPAIPKSGTQ